MNSERIYKLFKDLFKKKLLTVADFKDLSAEEMYELANMLISQYYRDFELLKQ